MDGSFSEVITTESQFRAVMGHPNDRVRRKHVHALDDHCRAFIAKCPFMLIASSDAAGRMDLSPKGDPAGFVRALDDHTLAIPERPGNRRADTFTNVLQNPHVGLIFLIPGKQETLRVSGIAMIVRDPWIREEMAADNKTPDFVLVVKVEEVFFHCAKCLIRSKLWDVRTWPALDGVPSLAQTLVDHAKLEETVDEVQARIDRDVRERLY